MSKQSNEKYTILGIISSILMVLSTIPLYFGYLAKVSVGTQRTTVMLAIGGFVIAYFVAIIDLIFGKKNKNFSVLTIVMETVIAIIIALAYIIL